MITFKTDKERSQYVDLSTKNPKLVELLIDLDQMITKDYGKNIVLTSVFRTPDEQAALYSQATRKVTNSAHSTNEAVDLRSWTFTDAERDEIVAYLNNKYKNANGKPVAMCHSIPGGTIHFHIALYR
jgi:uncharacterized protein YcbK (DUF882 family)